MERLAPFQIPSWTSFPSDDEIVRAIVGTSGSEGQRADAETVTRTLLLPLLRAQADGELAKLRFELESMQTTYEMFDREALGDELLRFAVSEAVAALDAKDLGTEKRDPSEHGCRRCGPRGRTTEAFAMAHRTVPRAATVIHYRMLEIEGSYASRLPIMFSRGAVDLASKESGEHRTIALARNHVYVALTGDYAKTSGCIFTELWTRGIRTRRVAEDRP